MTVITQAGVLQRHLVISANSGAFPYWARWIEECCVVRALPISPIVDGSSDIDLVHSCRTDNNEKRRTMKNGQQKADSFYVSAISRSAMAPPRWTAGSDAAAVSFEVAHGAPSARAVRFRCLPPANAARRQRRPARRAKSRSQLLDLARSPSGFGPFWSARTRHDGSVMWNGGAVKVKRSSDTMRGGELSFSNVGCVFGRQMRVLAQLRRKEIWHNILKVLALLRANPISYLDAGIVR